MANKPEPLDYKNMSNEALEALAPTDVEAAWELLDRQQSGEYDPEKTKELIAISDDDIEVDSD